MPTVECRQDSELTKVTPYLILTGELWVVFCEYLGKCSPCYNGAALYEISCTFIIHSCWFPWMISFIQINHTNHTIHLAKYSLSRYWTRKVFQMTASLSLKVLKAVTLIVYKTFDENEAVFWMTFMFQWGPVNKRLLSGHHLYLDLAHWYADMFVSLIFKVYFIWNEYNCEVSKGKN